MFMFSRSLLLAFLLFATTSLLGRSAAAQRPTIASEPRAVAEAAIRQAAEAYLSAIRQGNAEAVAARWTEDGTFVDANGKSAKGRDLARDIQVRVQEDQVADEPLKIDSSIRFITSDVAIEDGEMPGADSDEWMGRFMAIWVKRDGAWLLDNVRESHLPRLQPHDHLLPLAWLVGQWRAEDDGHGVEVTCDWSPDGNFLIREIRVSHADGPTLAINQRIGWDGAGQQIRSWTFDSAGGHGEGIWTSEGKQWLVTATAMNPEGHAATSRNTYTLMEDGSILWESSQAEVAGKAAPDQKLHFVQAPVME